MRYTIKQLKLLAKMISPNLIHTWLLKGEFRHEKVEKLARKDLVDFGTPGTKRIVKILYEVPLDEVPMHINCHHPEDIISRWRLMIGR